MEWAHKNPKKSTSTVRKRKKFGATMGATEWEKKFNTLEYQLIIYLFRLPLPPTKFFERCRKVRNAFGVADFLHRAGLRKPVVRGCISLYRGTSLTQQRTIVQARLRPRLLPHHRRRLPGRFLLPPAPAPVGKPAGASSRRAGTHGGDAHAVFVAAPQDRRAFSR